MTALSVHASPGPDPSSLLTPPAPAARSLPSAAAQGVPPRGPRPRRPQPAARRAPGRAEAAAGLQVGLGRGRVRGQVLPRQGSGGRRAPTGRAITYRRLMVPRRLSPVLALTTCARKPREYPGSRAEIHSGPFKRGRARGPPGLPPPRPHAWASRRLRPTLAPPLSSRLGRREKRTCDHSASWWPQARTLVLLLRGKYAALGTREGDKSQRMTHCTRDSLVEEMDLKCCTRGSKKSAIKVWFKERFIHSHLNALRGNI